MTAEMTFSPGNSPFSSVAPSILENKTCAIVVSLIAYCRETVANFVTTPINKFDFVIKFAYRQGSIDGVGNQISKERRAMLRRDFLIQSALLATTTPISISQLAAADTGKISRLEGTSVTLCLNAFSFNQELKSGQMSVNDVIDFCARYQIRAVDMTAYYLPGYPEVPSDQDISDLKHKAFVNGVTISGTGVRNDFSLSDPIAREAQIDLVLRWIDVAAKLGADVLRVFSGPRLATGFNFEQTLDWMIPAFQKCAEYGRQKGVIIGLQPHHDVLKTAEQTIQVVEAVNSRWFGVILDVGSLRERNVYDEIEQLLPYAVTWQVKQLVWLDGEAVPIDLFRLRRIIEKQGYRGYLPFEALGSDDTVDARITRVAGFLNEMRQAFSI